MELKFNPLNTGVHTLSWDFQVPRLFEFQIQQWNHFLGSQPLLGTSRINSSSSSNIVIFLYLQNR